MLTRNPQLETELKEEGLRYSQDSSPGYFRQKFKYYDLDGKVINDKKILERINSLAIPPAWDDVWVSARANGHLQATGRDQKRRKQYIYHPDWIKISQMNKFANMVDFGLSLPKIRSKVHYDLALKKMEKRKILATVVWLLENTFIRIGNEEYTKENNSYGLTTLRNKHVKISGSKVYFRFRGKSGVDNLIEFSHPSIAKTIKKCSELPGFEIFKFIDEDGKMHVIDSLDVNLFLKDITKKAFSAKDFRTWGGTHLSADNLYKLGDSNDKNTLKKNISLTIKKVASHLNNTVSVCKNYYIHPVVIQTYIKKILIPHFSSYFKAGSSEKGLSWNEYALIKLIQKQN